MITSEQLRRPAIIYNGPAAAKSLSGASLLTEACQQGIRPYLQPNGEVGIRCPADSFTPEWRERLKRDNKALIEALRNDAGSVIMSLVILRHALRIIDGGVRITPPPPELLKAAVVAHKWEIVRLLSTDDVQADANSKQCRHCWARANSTIAAGLCQRCEPWHLQNVQEAARLVKNQWQLRVRPFVFPMGWEEEYQAELQLMKMRTEHCDDPKVRQIFERHITSPEPNSAKEWRELGRGLADFEHGLRQNALLPRWKWQTKAAA
jgi:hypothetical protein